MSKLSPFEILKPSLTYICNSAQGSDGRSTVDVFLSSHVLSQTAENKMVTKLIKTTGRVSTLFFIFMHLLKPSQKQAFFSPFLF